MFGHHFGDTSVTRVVEQHGAGFAPDFLFPDWDPEVLAAHRQLMVPDCFDEAQHKFIASIHTWVVKTRHHTILIDSCGGNHKNRPELPRFHQQNYPFLERLAEAGVSPESVDYVMCTHLHVDHCGWNTQLVDGRWVPTFPNARYIFSKAEYDFWSRTVGESGFNANVFEDSVLPVIQSQQADIIDGTAAVGDQLRIHPTPGHSIGHISIELVSDGGRGIFSGDIMHQPLQVFQPNWNSRFCDDPAMARVSRQWLLEYALEHGTTIFTSHFGNSSAGNVSRRGDLFDWTFI
ncbi:MULTISPECIES: MBL fold metallo-hydrolase [Burkholderiaceae]|uniref:Beta-lactamase-like protein n=1 Tax=Caballeronia sordidicola TaxID=196367 RepID=A0A242M947_CABSO|nr:MULTISPECIES: MBL fold metallo-hydrolase [Burkholderiaceae]AME28331.1 MBL fold metallo-hydrolase [Burkholderia sp. PAMC 26561]OTP67683.1 beta-lactamase-like protein [Caballeronia sordidicola]OTP67713.1 Beta-lactamase-like protein [Caballeronia sordidicola]